MTTIETAKIEVVCPGMLEVLSVGKGDLKLTVGGDDPEDIEKARKLIEEMLRKGYSIFVETDKGPSRVKKFNPKRMSYTISDFPEEELPTEPVKAGAKPRARPRKVAEKNIPVAGSRATAVGRTAGG